MLICPRGSQRKVLRAIWSSISMPNISGAVQTDITDHFPVFVCYPGYFAPNEGCQVMYRKHTDAQIERFIDEVENFVGTFSAININDVNMLVEFFCEKLYDIYDRSFPIETKTSEKRNHSPWITRSLLDSIDRKNSL